jgi:hypothetical protein
MAVLVERMAAFRACLVRKVETAADGAVGIEMRPVAVRADIVRRKRIDFRNAGHGSNEG